MKEQLMERGFVFGNATHVGKVRKANEDYFGSFDTQNGFVLLVCDGMGGHVGGAVASQLAVESIQEFLSNTKFTDPAKALSEAIIYANQAIVAYMQDHPELRGMGTTCVAIIVKDACLYYAHVGDSRIYIYSHNRLHRLTKDHSFVQRLVDLGEITEEEAEKHPRRNEITNALGLSNMAPPTIGKAPIEPLMGDSFLLCSDGLTGMVREKDISKVLRGDMTPQEKAARLVEMANVAGGVDNTTVQIINFTQTPQKVVSKVPVALSKKIIFVAVALLLVVGLLVTFFFCKESSDDVVGTEVIFTDQEVMTKDEAEIDIVPDVEEKEESLTDDLTNATAVQQSKESLRDILASRLQAKNINWSITAEFDGAIRIPVDSILVINDIEDKEAYAVLLILPNDEKDHTSQIYQERDTIYIKGEGVDEVKYEIVQKGISKVIRTAATIYLSTSEGEAPSIMEQTPIPPQQKREEYDLELKTL